MAAYFNLLTIRNQPVEAIFKRTDEAEENRVRECDAATKIQSIARMRRARSRYLNVRGCILAMQRTWRGYCGRKRFLDLVHEAQQRRTRAVFDHFATAIQRIFRGFYSRKWRSDFYSQKHYLQQVEARSQAVRQEAAERRAQQEVDVAEEEAQQRRAAFRQTAGGLHHLLSTAVRSGVLRPAVAESGLETVFGTNIEDELRDAVASAPKRKFKSDIIPRKGQHPPPKGGSHVPQFGIGHAPYQKSLQSSAPYDAEREGKLLERAVDAKLASQFHPTSFATRKVKPPPVPASLNADSEYMPGQSKTRRR